jgi:tRNA(His) guanylyltransferase
MQKQSLGDRMKAYENVTRYSLSPKSFVLARIDGKAFHTYTKGLERPFDDGFIDDMNQTAIALCKEIQNAKFAFVQSDEISILIHETEQDTCPWFDNNLQKMASVSASTATAAFNHARLMRMLEAKEDISLDEIAKMRLASFDARFWTIPTLNEVVNYFMWRQQDATKNSISAVAQAKFSHKRLEGKSGDEKQEMLFQEFGINWNNFESGKKRGRFIEKVTYVVPNTYKKPQVVVDTLNGNEYEMEPELVTRSKWDVVECPIFSQDKEFLLNRIKVNY